MSNNITSKLKYKESVVKFSYKYGVLCVKLRSAGYTRTIQGLYLVMQRMGIYKKAPSKKKESEPSEWITGEYPGEKVQERFYYKRVFCSL